MYFRYYGDDMFLGPGVAGNERKDLKVVGDGMLIPKT